MDTNTMYIEHYVDLHNYISDNIYELDNSPSEYLCELTLIEAFLGSIGISFIAKTIDSLINKFRIKPFIDKLKNFKNHFKQIKISKEQFDEIKNNKKYFDLSLTESELKKIIVDLNKINEPDSFYDKIIKNPTQIQNLMKSTALYVNQLIETFVGFFNNTQSPKMKMKRLINILKINNEIGTLRIHKSFDHHSFDYMFNTMNAINAISRLLDITFYHFNVNGVKTIIKNRLDDLTRIKQFFIDFEKNNDLNPELKELLNGKKLADAVEDALKNIASITKMFGFFDIFLQLSVDIINKNN